ncbi:MAG: NAD(P)/FAD-dependent oxidoreductase [Anaerolineales bacterium]
MKISTLPKTAEVVVIGGGIMGASTAYHLSLAGQPNVIVLERSEHFEDSATNRCAGGVRYQFSTEINIELSKASLPMIERFDQEVGVDPQYRACGYLLVATNPEDADTFKGNIALQNQLGVQSRWLSGDETRSMVPQMRFADALGASFHDKDGLADPGSMLMGYHRRSRQLGARVATGVEVTGVLVDSGHVKGVETNYGKIEAPVVVNAAGPWAGQIGEMAAVEIPIRPIRRQMITTTPLPGLDSDFPFVVDFAQSLYFHREGEGILTGMSNPNEQVGFDQNVDEDWELEAMAAAMERLPLLEQAGRLSGWAGLYEVTPDAHPIYGATPVGGFYVVGGFSGHGFMHGPISGKLMSEIILDGAATTVDVSTLSLDRFDSGKLIQEHNVI